MIQPKQMQSEFTVAGTDGVLVHCGAMKMIRQGFASILGATAVRLEVTGARWITWKDMGG